jgi:hypothetical protein
MNPLETAAFGAMLEQAVAARADLKTPSVPVSSSARLGRALQQWMFATTDAVWLREDGTAQRLDVLTELPEVPWPVPGVLAAADCTWVLTPGGSLRLLWQAYPADQAAPKRAS